MAVGGALTDRAMAGRVLPYLRDTVRNYFHPAGTCAIGAVVDAECRVHGIEGLFVADASVMPTIPRANTNLSTIAVAERLAESLIEMGPGTLPEHGG